MVQSKFAAIINMNQSCTSALKLCSFLRHNGMQTCHKFIKSSLFYSFQLDFQKNRFSSQSCNPKLLSKRFQTNEILNPRDILKEQHLSLVKREHTDSKQATDLHVQSFYDRFVFPEPPELVSDKEHDIVLEEVNKCLETPDKGRLFAIISLASQQFKVTDNDIIRTMGTILGAGLGDRIRLEKVLLVGGRDFTLVGRPILRRSLVKVEATVIEQTPGDDKVVQYFKPKKRFQRRYIFTPMHVVLRINSVEAYPELLS